MINSPIDTLDIQNGYTPLTFILYMFLKIPINEPYQPYSVINKASIKLAHKTGSVQSTTMATSQKLRIFYIFGFFLLFNGVISEENFIRPEAQIQRRNGIPYYPKHFQTYVKDPSEKNFTGFRSAFQWSIGKTIDNNGIHNAMLFKVKDLATQKVNFDGQIGIYSHGSQIGIHLSFESVASSSPGPSFICSNNFLFFPGDHACFNSNYSLISYYIYYILSWCGTPW